ncbi:MAG: toll/interleukin-1 receptor domain-containing protein [Anaerolineae bacterium]|nr:toll/interleukin-1 receptor domain-containing protein [Anaerolineae bacterium]
MSYVFISYHASAEAYVRQLAAQLMEARFNIWLEDSRATTQVAEAAINSCGAFVFTMTQHAQPADTVMRELALARKASKPIFPLWISGDKWAMFSATSLLDVRDGNLPSAEFRAKLAEMVPVQTEPGRNVPEALPRSNEATGEVPQTMLMRPPAFRQLTNVLRQTLAPATPEKKSDGDGQ